MKPTIRNTLFLSLALNFIFSLMGCTKSMVNDCDPNNPPFGGYNLIPKEEISYLFPYKELDTIKMIKNGRDTFLFVGINSEMGYNTSFDQDPNCPHAHKDQWMKHTFTDKNNNSIVLDAYIDDIEKYLISLNQNTYGPVYAIDITNYPSTINIYAGGVEYKSVYALYANNKSDTCYFQKSLAGVVRIKSGTDVYEKLP
ncbi:MAG: hypothetical protein WCO54_05390 [Bacteroidota bacterium]